MPDSTERVRRQMVSEINPNAMSRKELEALHGEGNVWNTGELSRDFTVEGFMAPFCVVSERASGRRGSVMFQDSPRFYYNFQSA